MHTKRPLAPSFLNRLDRYLLLNKPEIWSARTHLVLYYGILFIALLTGIAFIVPDDPRTPSVAGFWTAFVWLISFVSFIGWLIYLLRFNVFKRYGLTSPVNRLITFILYFIAIGIFVLFGYVKSYVETLRANAAYTEQELVNDVNTMNLGIATLAYDSLNHKWVKDSVLVVDSIPDAEMIADAIATDTLPIFRKIERESLADRLLKADSVRKINDSVYVFYQCPDYVFLYPYGFDKPYDSAVLTSVEIYRKAIQNYTRPKDTMPLFNQVNAVKKKYQWEHNEYYYYNERTEKLERIEYRYGARDARGSMSNILERKHQWSGNDLEVFIRVFLYSTLILSILVFTFRHSTAKTFFLSILTAIVLTVLTSLTVAFAGYQDESVLTHIISYFIVALLLSLTAFTSKTRNVFTGISINICLWLLPFIPLCLVARHYSRLRRNKVEYYLDYEQMRLDLQLAEIIGVLLLLVLIATYFHRAYRKWYAAPEN
jgi:hypothetical protein